jgi:hypothetical protein
MHADATCAVAIGVVLMVRSIALDCVVVMMCHWAQRHGREAQLELRHAKHRLRFRSWINARDVTHEARDAPVGRAGAHHSQPEPGAHPPPETAEALASRSKAERRRKTL